MLYIKIVDKIFKILYFHQPFPWFRMAYFVLWSSIYVAFQWILHACGFSWWACYSLNLLYYINISESVISKLRLDWKLIAWKKDSLSIFANLDALTGITISQLALVVLLYKPSLFSFSLVKLDLFPFHFL